MLKRKYFTVEEVLDQIWSNDGAGNVDPTAGIYDTLNKNINIEDDEKFYAAINPGSDEESGAEDEPIFSEDEEIFDVNEESQESYIIQDSKSRDLQVEAPLTHDTTTPIWQGVPAIPLKPFVFTGKPGASDDVLNCEYPTDFFKLVISEELVNMIVHYTNN